MGVFSCSGDEEAATAAAVCGGVTVFSPLTSVVIKAIGSVVTCAALTRGVGKLSCMVVSSGLGRDSVDVPGRAKVKTEGSISRGLSDERSSEPIKGNVAALREGI